MNYILYYIIFGFVGWIIEFIYINLLNKQHISFCGDTITNYCNICIPFLNIYGLGAVLLVFLSRKYPKMSFFLFALIGGIYLTIMECIIGNISFTINKVKKWNYHSYLCNGFISFDIFIYWIICSYIFRWIYYFIEEKI